MGIRLFLYCLNSSCAHAAEEGAALAQCHMAAHIHSEATSSKFFCDKMSNGQLQWWVLKSLFPAPKVHT